MISNNYILVKKYASKLPDGEAFLRDVAAQQIRNVASDYQKTSVLNAIKNYRDWETRLANFQCMEIKIVTYSKHTTIRTLKTRHTKAIARLQRRAKANGDHPVFCRTCPRGRNDEEPSMAIAGRDDADQRPNQRLVARILFLLRKIARYGQPRRY